MVRGRIYGVKPEIDFRVGDRIDDPIRALANTILIFVARKFFTTGRPRIGRKILNALDDAETVFLGG
jgi:hypothetical protein